MNKVLHQQIVCGLADEESAQWVFGRALELARAQPTLLHVIHCARGGENLDRERERFFELLKRSLELGLDELVTDETLCKLHIRRGEPALEISDIAAEVEADAVVVGASRRDDGDIAATLLKEVACRLEVVRPKDYSRFAAGNEPAARGCQACREEREKSGNPKAHCDWHDSEDLPLSAVLAPRSHISTRPTTFG